MEREAEYLLHLLGAYLRKEAPEVRADVDWNKLMQLSFIHNITGVLGYMSMTYPICPDEQMRIGLRKICLNTIMGFANRGALAEDFSRKLAQQGIDHVLMKGFILRNFFPVPELRTFGDVDLVIRLEDRRKCDQLMKDWGYQPKADWEPVFSYTKENEYYEIHTQLMEVDVSEKADYRGYFGDLWQHVAEMEAHRYQFLPEYHFLYLLTHIAKHVTGSGAGIRMYMDIAVFLQHYAETLDWDAVRRELDRLCLADFANVVLTMVQKGFGISSPIPLKPVSEEVMQAFTEFTMSGGIFGKADRDSGTNSLKAESRESGDISRAGTLAKRLFPSAQSIQSRYTYLQKKPWLLPVAWVHRLVKTKDSWQQHAQEAQNILAADKEEVRMINRMYRDIGL